MHDMPRPAGGPLGLTNLHELPFAIVDVECTGTRVNGGDRIMEVAVVHLDRGEPLTAAEFLINPQRPVTPFVSRLTGISWRMLEEAPTFGDVAERLRSALEGRVFVGHNVRFDWRFLSMELRRATGRGLRGERLCTVRLARRLLPFLPRRNLDALAWHYEIPIIGRHRAGGDARATAQVLRRLLSEAARQEIHTWAALEQFLRTPSPQPRWSYLPRPVINEAVA